MKVHLPEGASQQAGMISISSGFPCCIMLISELTGGSRQGDCSVHAADEGVDELFPVAILAALNVVVPLAVHATRCAGQLEGPQEVVGLLEIRADGVDFVNQVLHADDALLAQRLQHPMIQEDAGCKLDWRLFPDLPT